MSEWTEARIQAVLMQWLLHDKHHEMVITNSTVLFPWEADLASATRAGYSHEFEIKISVADFERDKEKKAKHRSLAGLVSNYGQSIPNYFWYAVPEGMAVTVPDYAGLVNVYLHHRTYGVSTVKEAPRLHTTKLGADKTATIARLLSFRLLSQSWAWLQNEVKP